MVQCPTFVLIRGLAAVLVFLAGNWTPADCATHRVLTRESERRELFQHDGGSFRPVWEARALFDVDWSRTDEPVIVGVDADGNAERVELSIPGGRYLSVLGVSGGVDGSIAAAGGIFSDDGQPGTFLERITPDRSQKVAVQLAPYVPDAVTIAPDGAMWTVGWIRGPDGNASQNNVLKRFDSSGKLLTTVTVAARGHEDSSRNATETSLLASSKDRVAWLTNMDEYIEFALNGRELGRYPRPPGPAPEPFGATLALSENDDVLVGTGDGKAMTMTVWSLDRASRSWTAVELPGIKLSYWTILGFDGDHVVIVDSISPTEATVARYAVSTAE
jgi:hypothetical protein